MGFIDSEERDATLKKRNEQLVVCEAFRRRHDEQIAALLDPFDDGFTRLSPDGAIEAHDRNSACLHILNLVFNQG